MRTADGLRTEMSAIGPIVDIRLVTVASDVASYGSDLLGRSPFIEWWKCGVCE
jgi:hypothetical protein